MSANGEWIRARGLGRERLASYLAEYLVELGYAVERAEVADPAASVVAGTLKRMNPAVPVGLTHVRLKFTPTSGGAAGSWETPSNLPADQKARADRFVRELVMHLERAVRTESHGTAKLQSVPGARLPWDDAGPSPVPPG